MKETTVLVIDDESAVRKSFALALDEICHVDVAESGEIGVDKFQKAHYELVFLDLKMPGMNGVETLKKLGS